MPKPTYSDIEEAFPEDAIKWLRQQATMLIDELDPPPGLLQWLGQHGFGLLPLWPSDQPGQGNRPSWEDLAAEAEIEGAAKPKVEQFQVGDRVRFLTKRDPRGQQHMGEGQIDWVEKSANNGEVYYGVLVPGGRNRTVSPALGDKVELVASNTSGARSRPEGQPQSQEATPPAAQRR